MNLPRDYVLILSGCDDMTMMRVLLTESEFFFLRGIAQAISEKGGGCRPVMLLESFNDLASEDRRELERREEESALESGDSA